jgi:hypothetical protein
MSVLFHETEATAEGWPTARRYPRSLSEAFADVRAPAIQCYRPHFDVTRAGHRAVLAVGIVGLATFAILLLAGWMQ